MIRKKLNNNINTIYRMICTKICLIYRLKKKYILNRSEQNIAVWSIASFSKLFHRPVLRCEVNYSSLFSIIIIWYALLLGTSYWKVLRVIKCTYQRFGSSLWTANSKIRLSWIYKSLSVSGQNFEFLSWTSNKIKISLCPR